MSFSLEGWTDASAVGWMEWLGCAGHRDACDEQLVGLISRYAFASGSLSEAGLTPAGRLLTYATSMETGRLLTALGDATDGSRNNLRFKFLILASQVANGSGQQRRNRDDL